ncbi:MAG TPA: hypothetical protein VGY76_03500 [Solirubrobacteraceae bacterium]|nr:hypothetical protein [Solirubrobacteraceae bacterium]
MNIHRTRAILLGFLTLLAIGSFAASAAAEAGPFWSHRPTGGKSGTKIEEKAQDEVAGSGGEQRLNGTIGKEPVEIVSTQVQIKGHIWNNARQGQAKLEIRYVEPRLAKPALSNCTVKVGQNNIFNVQFHLAWKWNGTEAQLLEQPQANQVVDGILYPLEVQPGEIPKETAEFTSVTLSGSGCGVLAGTFKAVGYIATALEKTTLGEFNTSIGFKVENGSLLQQHIWAGSSFLGLTTVLKFANNNATYNGAAKVGDTSQQEVAVTEK